MKRPEKKHGSQKIKTENNWPPSHHSFCSIHTVPDAACINEDKRKCKLIQLEAYVNIHKAQTTFGKYDMYNVRLTYGNIAHFLHKKGFGKIHMLDVP